MGSQSVSETRFQLNTGASIPALGLGEKVSGSEIYSINNFQEHGNQLRVKSKRPSHTL
jgi:hypothetical protein